MDSPTARSKSSGKASSTKLSRPAGASAPQSNGSSSVNGDTDQQAPAIDPLSQVRLPTSVAIEICRRAMLTPSVLSSKYSSAPRPPPTPFRSSALGAMIPRPSLARSPPTARPVRGPSGTKIAAMPSRWPHPRSEPSPAPPAPSTKRASRIRTVIYVYKQARLGVAYIALVMTNVSARLSPC